MARHPKTTPTRIAVASIRNIQSEIELLEALALSAHDIACNTLRPAACLASLNLFFLLQTNCLPRTHVHFQQF